MTRFNAGTDFGDVLCNGVELQDVVECDDNLGFAVVYARDADDQPVLDLETQRLRLRLVVGRIQFVRWPDGPATGPVVLGRD
jgi:hypothetical protein